MQEIKAWWPNGLCTGLRSEWFGFKPWLVQFNKLKSVFHASVLLLIMNFVITLSK